MTDEKWGRVDVIQRHLRALAQELDGEDSGGRFVGNAYVETGRVDVSGDRWDCLNLSVRDDRGKRWELTVAISPAGRSARVWAQEDGRLHGRPRT